MRATARLLLLGLILGLMVPLPALAQSAGDDQYVDPFQNDGGGNNGNSGNSGNSGSEGGSETTAPDTSTGTEGGDGTASAGAESAGGDGTALPRTGLVVGGVAIAGVTLFLGGAALRRRA